MLFTYSIMAIAYMLSSLSELFFGTSVMSHVTSWYIPLAERHPGFNVFSWFGFTVLFAITAEKFFSIAMKKFTALQKSMVRKNIRLLSFITGAVLTSAFLIGFPSAAGWSEITALITVLVIGAVIVDMPNQIAGGFFMGVFARRLYIRVIVPLMVHIKTRKREVELPQSEAFLKLFITWKWLITAGAVLFCTAPLLFGPGGAIGSSTLVFVYSKTMQWYTILTTKYPFMLAFHWIGVTVVLASILEVAVKKITKPGVIRKADKLFPWLNIFQGDEYAINRLTTKTLAMIGALFLTYFSSFLLPVSSFGLSVSVIMVTVMAGIEMLLHAVAYYNEEKTIKQQKVKKVTNRVINILRALSIASIAAGLLFLSSHFPALNAWDNFLPAAATGAWYAGVLFVYLMISGFVLSIFIPRINRVFQPLFSFFFLIIRWRSKAPGLTIVGAMGLSAVTMFGAAYLLSAKSLVLYSVIVPIFVGIGIASVIEWQRRQRALLDKKGAAHRLELKFELEYANDEPAMVRDMLEARGMVPDRGNVSKSFYYNHSLYLDNDDLLTYHARENSYREYRFKARIRWYGDEELIEFIKSIRIVSDMTTTDFIAKLKQAAADDSALSKNLRKTIALLSKTDKEYADVNELKNEMLKLAGETDNVHLEIKNRLDTKMWKFACWVRREAVPEILALANPKHDGKVDFNWLPEKDRINKKAQRNLKEFCTYLRHYHLTPKIQVSYERLAYENAPNKLEFLNRLISVAIDYQRKIAQGENAEYWQTILDSPAGKYLRAILDSFEKFVNEYFNENHIKDEDKAGIKEKLANEFIALAVTHRRVFNDKLRKLGFNGKKDSSEDKKEKIAEATKDAKEYLEKQGAPTASHLYRLLYSVDSNTPEIPVKDKDIEYLRLTLDMNVRWRERDDEKKPTLFAAYKGFRRTWPSQTILEVKFEGSSAPAWVHAVIETLNELRADKPINDFPIKRQPAGKYCDSTSIYLYWKYLKGDFEISKEESFVKRLGMVVKRVLGLESGYPRSPRSLQWASYTKSRFEETFGINPEEPYAGPYGMEPLDYVYRGHVFPEAIPAELIPQNYDAARPDAALLSDDSDKALSIYGTPKLLLGVEKEMYTEPVREVVKTYEGDVEVLILENDDMDENLRVLQTEAFSRGIPIARVLKIDGMGDVDVKIAVNTFIEEQLRSLFMKEFSNVVSDNAQVKSARETLSCMANALPSIRQMDLDIFIANANIWQSGSAIGDVEVTDTLYIVKNVKSVQSEIQEKRKALVVTDAMLAVNPAVAAQIAVHNANCKEDKSGTKHILTIFNPAINSDAKKAVFLKGIGAEGLFDKVILRKDMEEYSSNGITRENVIDVVNNSVAKVLADDGKYEKYFVGGERHFRNATNIINSILRGRRDDALNALRIQLRNSYNDELLKIYAADEKTVRELKEQREIRKDSEEYKKFIQTYYAKVRSVLSSIEQENSFRLSA